MNVYEKMNECKIKLQGMAIKKSGKNDFTGAMYFTLDDILPPIIKLCKEYNLHTTITFPDGTAKMIITDIHKPEDVIVIESPFGSAALKGCHEVQNIGAVETYQRRYLYIAAFDIIENDILDSGVVQSFDVDIARIKACQTMEELTNVWKDIYKTHKSDKAGIQILTKEKDLMKETLLLSGDSV